jgi:hydroxymethylglutaryl-CoA lyase
MGVETGIDMNKLLVAAEYICEHLGRPTYSRAGRAIMSKQRRAA